MFFFTNESGKVLEFPDGVVALHSNVASPSFTNIRDRTDTGREILLGRELNERSIDIQFLLKPVDFQDLYLLRNELYAMLAGESRIYLHEKEIPFKRWRVLIDSEEMPEKGYDHAFYAMKLVAPHGYSESIGKTTDLLRFDVDKWQFGQGLTFEDKKYSHSARTFRTYNAGNLKVDPRKMPLKITFRGASMNLRIFNHTTDEEFRLTGNTSTTDKLEINGVEVKLNGKSILSRTNRKLLTVESGYNEWELIGTIGTFTIEVDHRFYYY